MSSSQPAIRPYLWVASSFVPNLAIGELVDKKYQVITKQIWQDLHPEIAPWVPTTLGEMTTTYLQLFPLRLHLPEVYGFCELQGQTVMLLNNIPLDGQGNLQPAITEIWGSASALQQAYWLWQILELWTPLEELRVAKTLLVGSNLRVDGWRLRCLELYEDQFAVQPVSSRWVTGLGAQPKSLSTLQHLGQSWSPLVSTAKVKIAPHLEEIVAQMQNTEAEFEQIASQMNQLLLNIAGEQPLKSRVFGVSDMGAQPTQNEDSCYPTASVLSFDNTEEVHQLASHCLIVCDGLGGHEGGEVASQLAVQSVTLQVDALLKEILHNPEIMTPDLVTQQLGAIIRVANNLIAARNDEQGRASRRRMGTTLVMALQLPQQVATPDYGMNNTHELYLAHVGDSRAYWLTARECLQVTLDDDVITREVRLGRSLHHQAQQRADAGALTQALGTRNAESLHPNIQRLIIQEDGVLLLCSDGLSDNDLVEKHWLEFVPQILDGKLTVEAAAQWLVKLANRHNGHDNISLALAHYEVSLPEPILVNLSALPITESEATLALESELVEYGEIAAVESLASVDDVVIEETINDIPPKAKGKNRVALVLGLFVLILVAGLAGVVSQGWIADVNWEDIRERWLKQEVEAQ